MRPVRLLWFARPAIGLDETARSLLIQEHQALRAEILASYSYAQSIVKWTLATFAATIAAALVAVFNATSGSFNFLLINVVLIILGFGIPGIVWLSSWTWLGELYRAERAGSYLRALENNLRNVRGLNDQLGFQPMRWESFIWSNRESRGLWGKQTMTYLGTAGVFFGAAAGSVVILLVVTSELSRAGAFPPDGPPSWLWPLASFLFNAVLIGVCYWLFSRLSKLGKAVAPVPSHF